MTVLKRVLMGVVVVIILVMAVGYALPHQIHVERSIVINAPQAMVFDVLDGFKRFNEFSPWAALDPSTQYTYSGPENGVGAKMSWTSTNSRVGSGTNEIIDSTPPDFIRTRVVFGNQAPAEATFRFEPADGGTRVTWGFDCDLGANPIAHYFGLMFDKWIGSDYEKGLARLKEVMEQANPG